MSVWRFILHYLYKTKWLAVIAVLSVISGVAFQRGQVYATSQLIGSLPKYRDDASVLSDIYGYLGLFAAFLLIENIIRCIYKTAESKFMPYFLSLVSKDVFSIIHRHSIRFFNEEMSGKIAGKIKNLLTGIQQFFGAIIYALIMPITSLIISMAFIFMADFRLGLFVSIITLCFIPIALWIAKDIGSFSRLRAKFSAESDGILVDTLTNIDLVKSFARYFYEKHYYYSALCRAVRAEQTERLRMTKLECLFIFVLNGVTAVSLLTILAFWLYFGLDLANVILCSTLMQSALDAVAHVCFIINSIFHLYGQIADGLDMLYAPDGVADLPFAHKIKMVGRTINFQNVGFAYPQKENLFNDFNLKIKSGEKIGLVGHSGSGKSTIIKLLVRYYDIAAGKITVGGENIHEVTQESLRDKIAVIPQDTTLFNRTIMENIRYGNPNATDEEVIAAAKQAYADEFIRELPDGYASKVGERGVLLSGGERQRIAIARAVLKNAPILILDEATSALDSQSEAYIQKSLKRLMKGKTVIAIAHRLSTLREMYRLLVMEHGKIVEEGSHDELLARKRIYYKFYKMQSVDK